MTADLMAKSGATEPAQLILLASVLSARGGWKEAGALCDAALSAAPHDPEIATLVRDFASRQVPPWHFVIVRDERRNAAYDAALRRAVGPEARVLEIGAGTGLLALMAARAGARTVVTCEMNPHVAAAAAEIVARNGYADRVRVIAKHSRDVDPAIDLDGAADVLVSEIVSNDLLSEHALPAYEDARRLLAPGARLIPARGIVRVALAHDAAPRRAPLETVDGFDLSAFNRLAKPWRAVSPDDADLTLASDAADLFDFDFQSGGPFPAARASVEVAARGGRANGIAQWIRLWLDGTTVYENDPVARLPSCWAVCFHPLPQPLDLAGGTRVTIHGAHDRRSIRLWTDG